MTFVDPTATQLTDFAAGDPAEPFAMLNLLKFREQAHYEPDAGQPARSGAEAYGQYGETATRTITEVGGRILFAGPCHPALVGPEAERWDAMALVYYPSRQAFLTMIGLPHYQAAIFHRTAGLADTRVIPVAVPPDLAPA